MEWQAVAEVHYVLVLVRYSIFFGEYWEHGHWHWCGYSWYWLLSQRIKSAPPLINSQNFLIEMNYFQLDIKNYLVNWSWLQMPGRSNRWDIYIPPYLACKPKTKTILTAVYLRIKLLNIFRNRNAKKKIIESRPQVTNFTRS